MKKNITKLIGQLMVITLLIIISIQGIVTGDIPETPSPGKED